MPKKPSHFDVADNINSKEGAFNSRLQNIDSMTGDVLDIDVGATNTYTITDYDFYHNGVFRIDDTAGAISDIDILVPATTRPSFVVINDSAQVVRLGITGQIATVSIAAGDSGHYYYDINGALNTIHGAIGDRYFSDVVVLLHGEGVDASTTITDSSSIGRVFTASGNAQIDTAQYKYGGASILFDGTGDYVSTVDVADLEIGAQDFTLEGFFRWDVDGSAFQLLAGKWISSGNQRSYGVFRDGSGNDLELLISNNGSTTTTKITVDWNPVLSTWYHVAVDFDGTTYRLYVDGVVLGTATTLISTFDGTAGFSVGAQGDGVSEFDGWADEVRLTIGTARYAGAFTPPERSFPDSSSRVLSSWGDSTAVTWGDTTKTEWSS